MRSIVRHIWTIPIGLLLSACAITAVGQSSPVQQQTHMPQGYTQPRPVSLAHLYWHFLVYQHHLDESAVEHEKQGKDGLWLRNYLQNKLGFTDEQFAPIRESADRLTAKVKDLDSKARMIAASDRESRKKGLVAPDTPAPGLEQLKALTIERETDINYEIESLNHALSEKDATTLRTFLQQRFSLVVRASQVDPNKQSLGSFSGGQVQEKAQP